MEDVAPCGEVEVVCWVLFEAEGFEGGEVVDGCEDGFLFQRLDEAGRRIGGGVY
jgi:hypothetical protein